MNIQDYDRIELEKKIDALEVDQYIDLKNKIEQLEKKSSIWQAYIETVYALGEGWRSLGRQTHGIKDLDYSLAHAILFKKLPLATKRVVLVKMEYLMNTRPFMKSDEALNLFKDLVSY